MRMRRWVWSGVVASVLFCLSAAAVAGETYTINKNLATDPSANIYNNLEDLRTRLGTDVFPGADDVIVLHNDDNSLIEAMDWGALNIRSAGNNRYVVSGAPGVSGYDERFYTRAVSPMLKIDGLRVIGTGGASGTVAHVENTLTNASGTVEIRDSILENNGGTGVAMINLESGMFRNTQIKGTATSVMMQNGVGDPGTLNVVFDRNADLYNKWDGTLALYGDADVGFNVAEGKYFSLGNPKKEYSVAIVGAGEVNLTKTGGGTLKLGSSYDDNRVGNLTIQQGTAHFHEQAVWIGNNIHVGKNGVFKPSIDLYNLYAWAADPENVPSPGDISVFSLNSFTSEEGARLEIGNISALPDIRSANLSGIKIGLFNIADINASNIASTLQINNKLMAARIEHITEDDEGDLPEGYYLRIEKVRDLNTLEGVGSYADIYRMGNLSEIERDMLDSIYARGGTSGMDRGFLQTVGGVIVQNTLLALRHNTANITGKINRRLTSYQRNELYEDIPADDGSGVCNYQDYEPETTYGEMWAFLDQSWMSQNDVDTLAGYRMATTTLGIGYDKHVDQWIYGGLLAYATSDMKLKSQSATRSDIENLTAALYASWAQDGWYISGAGIATYGWNDSRSSYTLPGVNLSGRTGNYASTAFGLNMEVGYMLETEMYGVPLRVTPYGGLTYARLHRNGTSETGAYNGDVDLRKHYRAANWNTWDGSLGVRVAAPMEVCGAIVVPSLDLSWTRVTGERTPSGGTVHMYNNPSGVWDLDLMSSNRSSVRLIAGVDARIKENMSVGASYEFEWRRHYWNNRLNVGVSLEF